MDPVASLTPPRVTRREWVWASAFAGVVMALTTVPYLVATASQNANWRFGGFLLAVEDGNSYIAKMGEGARGAWLFTLPYSTEPQRGVLVYSFYLLLGRLAGPDHDTQVIAYHAARIVFGIGLLLASYLFLAEFLPRVRQRRLGLTLVALGGGLGWLVAILFPTGLLGSLPVDIISPEAFSYLVLFGFPHLAAARTLFLLALLAFWRGRGLLAGLALIGVGLIQPVPVLVMWAVVGVYLALSGWWRHGRGKLAGWYHDLRTALVLGLLSAPLVVYTVYVLSTDPVMRQWSSQNQLPSPSPIHYLLAYGLWLAVAVPGWRVLWRRQPRLALLAGGWIAIVPFLLYIPVSVQRRFIEGVQLPLAVLVVLGLTVAARGWRQWIVPVVVGLMLPTAVLLWLGALLAGRAPAEPIFHPADELASFAWLRQNAAPGQAVLSAFETGNALPAYTPLVAYIGHGSETAFVASKLPRVSAFYSAGTADAARLALLDDGYIAYMIFGPHERTLGAFDPSTARYLQLRDQNGAYSVYEVVR
jgi:hypothetical protein